MTRYKTRYAVSTMTMVPPMYSLYPLKLMESVDLRPRQLGSGAR